MEQEIKTEVTESQQTSEKEPVKQKKKGGFLSKMKIWLVGLIIGILVGVGGLIYLQHAGTFAQPSGPEVTNVSVVFDRVKAQNELVCASQKYNITAKAKKANKIPFTDIDIPLTDNSFWYRYVGLIKVGVNLETAEFNQSGNTLTVTLDQPKISSNTPNMEESTVLEENNNIFNPIHIDDVDKFKKECIKTSEKESVDGGLLDEARANAEANIAGMFAAACGDQYEVKFNWR